MPWGYAAAGVASAVAGSLLSGDSGDGGGGASYYVPRGLSATDTGWRDAFINYQNLVGQGQSSALPAYQQDSQQSQAIN